MAVEEKKFTLAIFRCFVLWDVESDVEAVPE